MTIMKFINILKNKLISKLFPARPCNSPLNSDDFDQMEMMISDKLEVFTHRFAKWAGSASGFVSAMLSILVWLVAGAAYGFSLNWERGLAIYIGVVTFLMVFLIQRSQNKELSILHVKLNELISSAKDADNRLINVEELTEREISEVQDIHRKIGTEDTEIKM
jgi:low affinity Fe/Cu permease